MNLWRVCYLLGCLLILGCAVGVQAADDPLALLIDEKKTPLLDGDRLVFFGDTIAESGDDPGGHITILRDYLRRVAHPAVTVINAGLSANRVPDLQRRFQRDVLAQKPNIVVIQVGLYDAMGGTKLDRYETGLREMIGKLREQHIHVVLATPTVYGEKPDGTNQFDTALDACADVSRKIAADMKVGLCDLRSVFIAYLKEKNTEGKENGILTTDGIHLSGMGHLLCAQEVAKSLTTTLINDGPLPAIVDQEFFPPVTANIYIRNGVPRDDLVVRYTLDGSEPGPASPIYEEPFTLNDTTTIKARVYVKGKPASITVTGVYTRKKPRPADTPANPVAGLEYRYYVGAWAVLPDFNQFGPVATGIAPVIDPTPRKQNDNIGLVFTGFIEVPELGVYTFYTSSDDGSRLWIGDKMVVDNDGSHGDTTREGQVYLAAGKHAIKVEFFQGGGGYSLTAAWAGPGVPRQPIPATVLFHNEPARQ